MAKGSGLPLAASHPARWFGGAIVAMLHLLAFLALNHRTPVRPALPTPSSQLTIVEPVGRPDRPGLRPVTPSLFPPPRPLLVLPALPAIGGLPTTLPAPTAAPTAPARPLVLPIPSIRLPALPALPDREDRLRLFRDAQAEDDRIGNLARPKIGADDCTVADQRDLDATAAVSEDPTGSRHSAPGLACRAHQTADALKAANNRLTPR